MEKLILSFVFLIVFQVFAYGEQTAFAQGNEPPIPPAPANGNVVLDTLDWLTPDQEAEINAINKKLDAEGIAQIAVVTFDDCGADKKKFRYDLFNAWGIGHANDNDGLLILICWYAGDKTRRSVEQEVGYGLESTLPGTLTDRIAREYFVTAFQANYPGEGLVAMVKGYDRLLRQLPVLSTGVPNNQAIPTVIQIPALPADVPKNQATPNPLAQPQTLLFLGGLGLMVLLIVAALVRKIYIMDSTHDSRREEQREKRERRKIITIIASLVAGSVTIFLAVALNFSIALISGLISALAIATGYSWSYRGRFGKAASSGEDTSWFSSGHSSSGSGHGKSSGGGGGGGGFGGGSSGGGGSSTGF